MISQRRNSSHPLTAEGRALFDGQHELVKLAAAQRCLLPQAAPAVAGYELVLAYRPACIVTGDYHDFFHRPDGSTSAFVGDGAGHGPCASLLMVTMRTILWTHPDLHGQPGQTLTTTNRLFYPLNVPDRFMTGLYLLLGEKGQVSWAAAAHHPPLRISRFGHVAPIDLNPVGQAIGIEPHEVYETVHWDLEPGERLFLFTDGLVETRARNGEMFGRRRLQSYLAELAPRPLKAMVGELIARASAHSDGMDFEDDYTILAIERRDHD
jgi:phosphoserine phosphatase RsbU/P